MRSAIIAAAYIIAQCCGYMPLCMHVTTAALFIVFIVWDVKGTSCDANTASEEDDHNVDSRAGFTLVELLAVMAIMVIITGIGIASYVNMTRGAAISGAVRHVRGGLTLARQTAIMNGQRAALIVHGDGRSYAICQQAGVITDTDQANIFSDKWCGKVASDFGSAEKIVYNMTTGYYATNTAVREDILPGDIMSSVIFRTTRIEGGWHIDDMYGFATIPIKYLPRATKITDTSDVIIWFNADGTVDDTCVIELVEDYNPSYKPRLTVKEPTGFVSVKM